MSDMTEARAREEVADVLRSKLGELREEIGKMIVGNREVVDGVLTCLLAGWHALLEGVPGLGKTMLVRTLAEALDLEFSRIQFTPDLMPADIIGTTVHRRDAGGRQGRSSSSKGPIFANIVLADEINRATPKTQSALLEAMQEHRVTVGQHDATCSRSRSSCSPRRTRSRWRAPTRCPKRSSIASSSSCTCRFPTRDELHAILDRTTGDHDAERQAGARRATTSSRCSSSCARVPVARHVQDYAIRVLQATHPDEHGRAASW